jgi:hypothetical protein
VKISETPYSARPIDSLLQVEYYHLQKTIEDFDIRALTIKAWSVSFGLAAIVTAIASRANLIFLLASAGGIVFWLLEAYWKSFQLGYCARINAIENHFAGRTEVLTPHQISTSWREWWVGEPWLNRLRPAVWLHVALPHLIVAFGGLLTYLLHVFHLL